MSTPIDRRLDPRQADFVQPKREQTHVMAPPPLDGLRSANPRAGRRTAPAINAEETSAPTHSRLASIREPDRSRCESEDTRPRRGGRVAEPEARILDLVARLDPRRVALVLALWAAGYAAYRLYYGFGGQVGMIGEPRSPAQWREINLAGGLIILTAALLPLLAASLWRHRPVRNMVVAAGWVGLVGCWTHAITDQILRLLSLTGVHPTQFSPEFWLSIDRHTADLQDVLLNEPWFFVEGLLAGLLALTALRRAARPFWLRSAAVVCSVASIVGVLSGLDVIPRFHLG